MLKIHIQKAQQKMMQFSTKSSLLINRFNDSTKGTPAIETVAIVALVALAIFSNLQGLGQAVSNIFGSLTSKLNATIQ